MLINKIVTKNTMNFYETENFFVKERITIERFIIYGIVKMLFILHNMWKNKEFTKKEFFSDISGGIATEKKIEIHDIERNIKTKFYSKE